MLPRQAPRFTVEELLMIQDDANNALLNEEGALNNPGKWLGLVLDLSRALRQEVETRMFGTAGVTFREGSR
jgi:hypothetical protein